MRDPLSLTAADVEALPVSGASEVLDAWVKARRGELPLAVSHSPLKAHARLAKKALYQLKSLGLEVATDVPRAGPQPEPQPGETFDGVLSAILGTGERAVVFATPVRGGGLDTFEGVISDELGILQLRRTSSNRATYRKHLKTLTLSDNMRVLVVPYERIRLELERALSRNYEAEEPLTDEAAASVRMLDLTPQSADWALPAVAADDEAASAHADALLKEPEFEKWLPSAHAIEGFGAALEGAPEGQRNDLHALHAADYLTPALRKIYGRRLWQMAELLEGSARAGLARAARAEARRVFHTAERSTFFEAMFRRLAEHRGEGAAPGARNATARG